MNKKFALALILLVIAFDVVFALNPIPYFYNAENMGLSWQVGGIELRGNPGVFVCSTIQNPVIGINITNPLSVIFPSITTDC